MEGQGPSLIDLLPRLESPRSLLSLFEGVVMEWSGGEDDVVNFLKGGPVVRLM